MCGIPMSKSHPPPSLVLYTRLTVRSKPALPGSTKSTKDSMTLPLQGSITSQGARLMGPCSGSAPFSRAVSYRLICATAGSEATVRTMKSAPRTVKSA